MQSQVRSQYRGLLRAINTVFGKDMVAKVGAQQTARAEMDKNRGLVDPAQIGKLIDEMEDVRSFILTQVVQAEVNEDSTHVVLKPKQRHSTDAKTPSEAGNSNFNG
eukprot:TRINITY_DN2153_c0_g1_i3.p2 TRINITY_DN2153_c0_g1~~TRINITY_DN2153_c0_g1_i3.p2  ORF type:complete len:106 (-),score=28.79 TRINITY_DN2153_c0_g1_i3:336-653(-)